VPFNHLSSPIPHKTLPKIGGSNPTWLGNRVLVKQIFGYIYLGRGVEWGVMITKTFNSPREGINHPKNWLFSVTPENWEIVKAENIWAVRDRATAERLNKGDRLIFYVKGSQPPSFMGIYEVTGDWRRSTKQRWRDEVERNEIIYPWEVDVKPIQLGTANVRDLVPSLTFIEKKERWAVYLRGAPANFNKPIGKDDYELILKALGEPPYVVTLKPRGGVTVKSSVTSPPVPSITPLEPGVVPPHTEIRDMVLQLGELEDYIAEKEVPIDKERIDVTWRRKIRKIPDVVFEVQRKGDFYGALVKLKEAWDIWGCISVLITTQEYEEEAKRWLSSAFHEMERDARVVRWERIKRWFEIARERRQIRDEIKI
jgi:predicted RNA-binding protein